MSIMKRCAIFIMIALFSIGLISCGKTEEITSQKKEDDYTLSLLVNKGTYQKNEKIILKAGLSYSGRNETVIYYPYNNPFTFLIEDENGTQMSIQKGSQKRKIPETERI